MKVVFWILGIVGVIFLLLVVGGFFLGRSMSGSVEDGGKFAANATKQECVDEMAKRLRECDGIGCMMQTSGFVAGCLNGAKGEFQEVCGDIPKSGDSEGMTAWRGEFCPDHELKDMTCEMAVATLSGFCNALPQSAK